MLTKFAARRRFLLRGAGIVLASLTLGFGMGTLRLAAGAEAQGSPEAVAACDAALSAATGYDSNARLVRAEVSRAGAVAAWQEGRHAATNGESPAFGGLTSPLRALPADQPTAVCLYSGTFVGPLGPPTGDGAAKPLYSRVRLLVEADGHVVLDAMGHDNGDLSPETPGDWSQ